MWALTDIDPMDKKREHQEADLYAIETRQLSRHFGNLKAVDQIDMGIKPGSLFGLIGPNGAGKTTTLRMLAGLLEPTSGQILINGKVANHDWQDHKRQIGYMPDFFGVYEDLLVWEYLDFFGRCYDLPDDRRQRTVDDLLDLVDLTAKREVNVQALSRGMKQRLCLAHALVNDPSVLLLDEPASGLDPRARIEMRELLRELRAMGKTVVVSSHILMELAEMCDSLAIIEQGKLIVSGSIEEIRRRASHERQVRIRALQSPAELEPVLSQVDRVRGIRVLPDQVEIDFHGDDESLAALLDHLLAEGIKVLSFNEIADDLEDLFLRLTKGEVA
jgi:ABC-2 type transport system ATP-binding protein